MLEWIIKWVVWLAIRATVTLACMITIQTVIHNEGYYIEFHVLLVCAVCLIVGVRMWMPSGKEDKK